MIVNQFSPEDLRTLLAEHGHTDLTDEDIENIVSRFRKNAQEEAFIHRTIRAANRAKTAAQKKRAARTHQLCNVGGAVLMYYPGLAELYPDELEAVFEKVFTFDPAIDAIVTAAIENRKSKNRKEA